MEQSELKQDTLYILDGAILGAMYDDSTGFWEFVSTNTSDESLVLSPNGRLCYQSLAPTQFTLADLRELPAPVVA